MYHIYNTMANGTEYIRHNPDSPRGVNLPLGSVHIKGGSGVHRKGVGTPLGVHTAVSDADYEWLKDHFCFKDHLRNGYLTVRKGEVNPEVAAAEMVTRDQRSDACPIVPEDFGDKEVGDGLTAIEPKTNKKSGRA